MGLLSRVAKVAGRVVAEVGGDKGQSLVDQARALRDKVRGEPAAEVEDDAPPPWPASIAPFWDRGHDLLSNHWPTNTALLRRRWEEVGASLERSWSPAVGSGAADIAEGWNQSGEAFADVWQRAGEQVAAAWEQAIRAPDPVEAEGILDGSIQSGWREIREAWMPVRLALREHIQRAAAGAGLDEARIKAAAAPVDAVWGVTETHLSDRFLDGGGYLVSVVREASEGQAHPAEILDTVQQMLANQEATWREAMDAFEGAWTSGAHALQS